MEATATVSEVGYLEVEAVIGPVAPVEAVGQPTPTASHQLCTEFGLSIFNAGGNVPIAEVPFDEDCFGHIELPPGSYDLRLPSGTMAVSKDLPKTIEILEGETTRISIEIDTGIR